MPNQVRFRIDAILFLFISLCAFVPSAHADAITAEPLSTAKVAELAKPFVRTGTPIVMRAAFDKKLTATETTNEGGL
jgi:hypothetical protein